MQTINKKYIFICMLAGKPVELPSSTLNHKEILQMLVESGVWKKDLLRTQKWWDEYSFKIIYPTRIVDEDGKAVFLTKGDHHLVCL